MGTNNLTNNDGTEREDISTIIKKIKKLCVAAKVACPNSNVIFSSILKRVGDSCKAYNTRARSINSSGSPNRVSGSHLCLLNLNGK